MIRARTALLAPIAWVTLAVPASAEDPTLTLGFRTGSSTQDIADGFEVTSFHVGPMVDASWGDLGLGFAFLWASYESDNSFGFPLPRAIQDLGGPSSISVPAQGNDSARFDFDVSLKYRINEYVTPFIGYRKEILEDLGFRVKENVPSFQQQLGEIASLLAQGVASGALTPQEAAQLQQDLDIDEIFFDLDLDFIVFGASLSYPLADLGLVPYLVGTGFAYTWVDELEQSFPGFSIEGGFAYLLGRHVDLPIYVTLSAKYQTLEADDNFAFIEDLFEGAGDAVPVKEEVFNTNVALFYRFDL